MTSCPGIDTSQRGRLSVQFWTFYAPVCPRAFRERRRRRLVRIHFGEILLLIFRSRQLRVHGFDKPAVRMLLNEGIADPDPLINVLGFSFRKPWYWSSSCGCTVAAADVVPEVLDACFVASSRICTPVQSGPPCADAYGEAYSASTSATADSNIVEGIDGIFTFSSLFLESPRERLSYARRAKSVRSQPKDHA